MGGDLDVDGVTLGAGKSIRPPRINRIGAARLEKGAGGPDDAPYVYKLINTITDLAVGGGGRYLLLTLKQADSSYALGVFDVNLATLLKRIPLSSPNTLVAAGAKRFLIASPDENQIQCWDLATLQPLGERRTSPIDGRLKSLAIGSDLRRSRARVLGRRAETVWKPQDLAQSPRPRFARRPENRLDRLRRLGPSQGGRIALPEQRCLRVPHLRGGAVEPPHPRPRPAARSSGCGIRRAGPAASTRSRCTAGR